MPLQLRHSREIHEARKSVVRLLLTWVPGTFWSERVCVRVRAGGYCGRPTLNGRLCEPQMICFVSACVLVRSRQRNARYVGPWVVRDGSVRKPATVSRCTKGGPKVCFLSCSPPRAPLEARGLGLTRERWQQNTGGRVVQGETCCRETVLSSKKTHAHRFKSEPAGQRFKQRFTRRSQ